MNPSADETLHLLQIWLVPNQLGIPPKYEQKRFTVQEQPNRLHLLASTDARDGSFRIHSDAELLAAKLDPGGSVTHTFRLGNGWLQIARGDVLAAGKRLHEGDGLEIEAESSITIESKSGAEFLLFDLA
jgi:redox-sensitive bicupin YhaK (pirin superfamily)